MVVLVAAVVAQMGNFLSFLAARSDPFDLSQRASADSRLVIWRQRRRPTTCAAGLWGTGLPVKCWKCRYQCRDAHCCLLCFLSHPVMARVRRAGMSSTSGWWQLSPPQPPVLKDMELSAVVALRSARNPLFASLPARDGAPLSIARPAQAAATVSPSVRSRRSRSCLANGPNSPLK